MGSLKQIQLLFEVRRAEGNKKALEASASRTNEKSPCYHLDSPAPHRTGLREFHQTPALSRALPSPPKAQPGRQPCDSKAIFSRRFRTPFHQPRLSVTYPPAYSPLPRLSSYLPSRFVVVKYTTGRRDCQPLFSLFPILFLSPPGGEKFSNSPLTNRVNWFTIPTYPLGRLVIMNLRRCIRR